MISPTQRFRTKAGRVLYKINVDDEYERADCLISEDVFASVKDNINVDDIIIIEGNVSRDVMRDKNKLSVENVLPISQYIEDTFSTVKLTLDSDKLDTSSLEDVIDNLSNNIALSESGDDNTLEIIVSLDGVDATFDKLQKPFSIYKFVNDISHLLNVGIKIRVEG
jgi:DNA polymerase-3 subunit alpha